jgi:hypothetical protein
VTLIVICLAPLFLGLLAISIHDDLKEQRYRSVRGALEAVGKGLLVCGGFALLILWAVVVGH